MNNIDILFYFSFFLLGLAIGSFLNVLIYRLPNGLGLAGRSICPHCKKQIAWYDNIPLLSFVFLKGRCRQCRFPIGLQYPAVELVTGVLFVLVFLFLPSESIKYQVLSIKYLLSLGYYLLIISSLVAIFFTDLKYGIIPDKIVYPSILISVGYLFLIHNSALPAGRSLFIIHVLSGLGAFLFFLFLALVTKGRGMGMGDVKLTFLMGIFLGFPKIIVALYIAFLTGAAISLILILWGKKRFFGGTVPFGPFLAFGTLLAFFFGEELLRLVSLWLNF